MSCRAGFLALVFSGAFVGCVATSDHGSGPVVSNETKPVPASTAPSTREPAARSPAARGTAGERPLKLQPFHVQEWAFSDFGLSVKTNFEVVTGGNVQWMEVSALEPGSAAALRGLARGDRILAIDAAPVTELSRGAMLEKLFQRKKGEQVRLLVMGSGDPLPRFVMLVAGRP